MKYLVSGPCRIALSLVIPFLWMIPACSNLYKLKSSNLHQLESSRESSVVAQESNEKTLHTFGSIFQNDSSNYWIWFQSNNPFLFHPDKGLEAESGNMIVGGNRLQSSLVQVNALQLSISTKDSAANEKLKMKEENANKKLEKERKGGSWFWLWSISIGVLAAFVAARFLFPTGK